MNRSILGRLCLAILLPLTTTAVLGLAGWHGWQAVQTARTVQFQVAGAVREMQARQAEYVENGPGYRRYVSLLNSGFADPAAPNEVRALIKKLAKQYDVSVQTIDIGEKLIQAAPAGTSLALASQSVLLNASAGTDTALFAFIDALRQAGRAELTLETMRLKIHTDSVTAELGLSWSNLDGAPRVDYTALPIKLPDELAPGKSLLAQQSTAAPSQTAMILQVEQMKP
jgi:hypothetical protein